jgi:hypothetical protein
MDIMEQFKHIINNGLYFRQYKALGLLHGGAI